VGPSAVGAEGGPVECWTPMGGCTKGGMGRGAAHREGAEAVCRHIAHCGGHHSPPWTPPPLPSFTKGKGTYHMVWCQAAATPSEQLLLLVQEGGVQAAQGHEAVILVAAAGGRGARGQRGVPPNHSEHTKYLRRATSGRAPGMGTQWPQVRGRRGGQGRGRFSAGTRPTPLYPSPHLTSLPATCLSYSSSNRVAPRVNSDAMLPPSLPAGGFRPLFSSPVLCSHRPRAIRPFSPLWEVGRGRTGNGNAQHEPLPKFQSHPPTLCTPMRPLHDTCMQRNRWSGLHPPFVGTWWCEMAPGHRDTHMGPGHF
jgi:hypothetical protein